MSKAKIVTKAKRITEEQYAEMRTRFQMGDGIREIARDFNYDPANLQKKFKKDGLIQGELLHLIDKKAIAAAEDLKTITTDILQITTELQQPLIQHKLNERAAKWLGIVEDTTDIALRLNHKLLIEVNNRSRPGIKDGYKPHESTQILRSIVATQGALLDQTGISAAPVSSKGNSKHSELAGADNAQDASRAYQELINGPK